MPHQKTKALAGLNIGCLIMSVAGIFAKVIAWPATVIIAGRMVLGFPFVLLWLVWRQERLRLHSHKDFFLLMGLGAILAVHWITYFKAVQLSTVATAIVAVHIGPILTTFLEPIITKTKLEFIDIVTAIIGFTGILIMVEDFTLTSTMTQGILFALLSALLMSIRTIYSRCFVKRYSGPLIMFYQLFFGAFLLFPLLPFFDFTITKIDIRNIFILAIFVTAIAHTLLLSSLKYISARSSGIMMMVQPLYATIFAAILIHEIPSVRLAIGGILILSATITETVKHSRPR